MGGPIRIPRQSASITASHAAKMRFSHGHAASAFARTDLEPLGDIADGSIIPNGGTQVARWRVS